VHYVQQTDLYMEITDNAIFYVKQLKRVICTVVFG